METGLNRREFLMQSAAAAIGSAGAARLAAAAPAPAAEAAPAGTLPVGTIGGKLKASRVILGGNLLTFFTHSRELEYVRDLVIHYNTEEKILDTLAVAERNGINTVSLGNRPWGLGILKRYRKERGGKMQWIITTTSKPDDSMTAYREEVDQLAADGADAIYMHGAVADDLVAKGRVDLIGKAVELIKMNDAVAGVGAHDLRVVEEVEKAGIPNDFYLKTFHHLDYPTAPRPEEMIDPTAEVPGYWCKDWKAVAERMKSVKKTWIAFKIMAAGAIPPPKAFQWAFENGGDHILIGLFDWQIAEDTALAREAIEKAKAKRERPWCS